MTRERVLDIGIGKGGDYIRRDNPRYSIPTLNDLSTIGHRLFRRPEAITEGSRTVLRVGFDQHADNLRACRREYAIPVVRGMVDSIIGYNLPFRDEAFDGIDIIYPHKNLLQNLVGDPGHAWELISLMLDSFAPTILSQSTQEKTTLWRELHRVIKPGKSVRIVLDVLDGTSQENKIIDFDKSGEMRELLDGLLDTVNRYIENKNDRLFVVERENVLSLVSTLLYPQEEIVRQARITGFAASTRELTSDEIKTIGTENAKAFYDYARFGLAPRKPTYEIIATKE